MEGPLVRLVQHHARVRREIRLAQKLAEQHTVRHILEQRTIGGAVLEPDRVADLTHEPTTARTQPAAPSAGRRASCQQLAV